METIYLAAGCFWGVEKTFAALDGVVDTDVGYMGGEAEDPTYAQVCTGTTGHAEAVAVVFDPAIVSISELLAAFFECHDPTQVNRQGNDIGTQYRSAIWATTPEQYQVAVATRDAYEQVLRRAGYPAIATQIHPEAAPWWPAEEYHQDYLAKNPNGYQCHARTGMACPIL